MFNIKQYCEQHFTPDCFKGKTQSAKFFSGIPSQYRQAVKVYLQQSGKLKVKVKTRNPLYHNLKRFDEKISTLPSQAICIDIEMYEWDQSRILEIGLSFIDIPRRIVETTHLIVRDHYNKRNTKFVPDNKDNFQFGESMHVPLKDALEYTNQAISYFGTLVGHGVRNDLQVLSEAGVNISRDVVLFDTSKLYGVLIRDMEKTHGLKTVCNTYGFHNRYSHNAGNDSHYTGLVFLEMLHQYIHGSD